MTGIVETAGQPAPKQRRRSGLALLLGLVLVAALVIGGLYWRKHALDSAVQTALKDETAAETIVYRRNLLGGNDIVFDVQGVDGQMSMADMTRRLLKTAEALKQHDFERVYLAYRGQEKFYFEGRYFKTIGIERAWQNPVYTIRTMPENVRNLDGSPAFESWSGGLLGVLGSQLDDANAFHRKWWADEALADLDP